MLFFSEAMNIGIIGQGFVGNAVYQKFKNFTVFTYDLNSKLCNSNFEEINKNCSIVFICLPTPMNSDGSCDISIVENMISKFSSKIIINKSTVPPELLKDLTLNTKIYRLFLILNF